MNFLKNCFVNTTTQIDIRLITHDVKLAIRESGIQDGTVVLLIPGATAGIALLEGDPKIHEEFRDWVEKAIPAREEPRPDRKSGTGRNHAHLRAALVGLTLSIPLKAGKLMSGPWQEVVLFDFDDRVGRREITVQILGGAEEA